MKTFTHTIRAFFVLIFILLFGAPEILAQASIGADVVSRYVWRGSDFGDSPAIQPAIEFGAGDFAIGAWGNYSINSNLGGAEADLYASYSIQNFSIGITDYYFPDLTSSGSYFDYENAHTFELNLGYAIEDFSLSANYYFAGAANDDLYFEAGYTYSNIDFFAGFGNESYTTDQDFNLVNLGLTASKDIVFTETFALPVFGSVILNPDQERIYLLFGFSL